MKKKTSMLCVVTVLLLIVSSVSVLSISAGTGYETSYFQESVDDSYTFNSNKVTTVKKYLENTVSIEAVPGTDTITVKAFSGGNYVFGVKESTSRFNERIAAFQCKSFGSDVQITKGLMGDEDHIIGAVTDEEGAPVRVKPDTDYVIFCFELDRSTLPAKPIAFGTATVRTLAKSGADTPATTETEAITESSLPVEVTGTTRAEVVEDLLRGDADMDVKVTVKDATVIQKHVSQEKLITHRAALKSADVNGDGEINITDATAIQKLLVA